MNEQERSGHGQGQPGYGQAYPYSPGAGQPSQHGWGHWGTPPPGAYGPQPGGQPYPTQQFAAPHHQRSRHPLRTAALTAGAVALSVAVGLGVGHFVWTPSAPSGVSGNQNFGSIGNQTNPSNTAIDPQAIAKKASPGIVNVNTELGYQGAAAAGTGIVLTPDGEVLTNNHVVEGATSIKVTDIGNGQTYTASVLGYDRSHDVAVLKLADASGLATETLGDSSSVKVGDAVVGLGNAGGAGGAPIPAGGRVTALNQSITASDESNSSSEKLKDLIQVDANIQSGDSGGPLVNGQGQVVGMDTAASAGYQFNGGGRRGHGGLGNGFPGDNSQGDGSQGDGSQGSSGNEGYAIPINQAISIAHQIVGGTGSDTVHIGKSAFLGVTVSDAGQQQQQQSGTGTGAAIQEVVPDGAAAKAGLVAGDVITAVDGKAVDSPTALTTLMDQHHPGDKLTVTVVDQTGQQQNVTVVPAEGPVG
ncbi:S1-C subfamily serine protease [Amycolatopsis echigonensis]|uniref:S1-C subfamily serine protease n=1 Tax=Amycolatopsis echigonensis TaxID=2576905 RepID=A0A2N3WRW3_9PSEU|nr:trypsin-like peptidase domain-containing protein [Amycolatopsis niigatensis]PKV96624.1 S1-C subfamily serine protease [Amycolatopsis niigatensis]